MLAPNRVLRQPDAETLLLAVREPRDLREDRPRHRHRQLEAPDQRAQHAVGRHTGDVLRHDPGAAAGRQHHRLRPFGDIDRDVDRRVADADDENPLALERIGDAVVVRVHRLAVERPREVGQARVGQVAIGDDHRPVVPRRPFAATRWLAGHREAAGGRGNGDDGAAEADALAQAEAVGVGLEVGQHLSVGGVVRQRLGEWEIRPAEALAGRIDVQAAVRRRGAAVIAVAPHPADVGSALDPLRRDPRLAQRLQRRQPGDAGTDHANVRFPHRHPPSSSQVFQSAALLAAIPAFSLIRPQVFRARATLVRVPLGSTVGATRRFPWRRPQRLPSLRACVALPRRSRTWCGKRPKPLRERSCTSFVDGRHSALRDDDHRRGRRSPLLRRRLTNRKQAPPPSRGDVARLGVRPSVATVDGAADQSPSAAGAISAGALLSSAGSASNPKAGGDDRALLQTQANARERRRLLRAVRPAPSAQPVEDGSRDLGVPALTAEFRG